MRDSGASPSNRPPILQPSALDKGVQLSPSPTCTTMDTSGSDEPSGDHAANIKQGTTTRGRNGKDSHPANANARRSSLFQRNRLIMEEFHSSVRLLQEETMSFLLTEERKQQQANGSIKTSSIAASSTVSNSPVPVPRETVGLEEERQSSFSKFVNHAKKNWNNLEKEAYESTSAHAGALPSHEPFHAARDDSILINPLQDISLYPTLPKKDSQDGTPSRPSADSAALEAFQKSHVQKIQAWRRHAEEKKDHSSSSSSNTAHHGFAGPNHKHDGTNIRQHRGSPKATRSNRQQSEDTELSISAMFEKRRQSRQMPTLQFDRSLAASEIPLTAPSSQSRSNHQHNSQTPFNATLLKNHMSHSKHPSPSVKNNQPSISTSSHYQSSQPAKSTILSKSYPSQQAKEDDTGSAIATTTRARHHNIMSRPPPPNTNNNGNRHEAAYPSQQAKAEEMDTPYPSQQAKEDTGPAIATTASGRTQHEQQHGAAAASAAIPFNRSRRFETDLSQSSVSKGDATREDIIRIMETSAWELDCSEKEPPNPPRNKRSPTRIASQQSKGSATPVGRRLVHPIYERSRTGGIISSLSSRRKFPSRQNTNESRDASTSGAQSSRRKSPSRQITNESSDTSTSGVQQSRRRYVQNRSTSAPTIPSQHAREQDRAANVSIACSANVSEQAIGRQPIEQDRQHKQGPARAAGRISPPATSLITADDLEDSDHNCRRRPASQPPVPIPPASQPPGYLSTAQVAKTPAPPSHAPTCPSTAQVQERSPTESTASTNSVNRGRRDRVSADAAQKGLNRTPNVYDTDIKPGAYQAAPGKVIKRNRAIRNSVISHHSMSALMTKRHGDVYSSFRSEIDRSGHSACSSGRGISLGRSQRISQDSQKSIRSVEDEKEQEQSVEDFYEPMPSYVEDAIVPPAVVAASTAAAAVDNESGDKGDACHRKMAPKEAVYQDVESSVEVEGRQLDDKYDRKMAANMTVSRDSEDLSSSDEASGSFCQSASHPSRHVDSSKPPPNTRYSGDDSNSNRAPSPPHATATRNHGRAGRPVWNVQPRASYRSEPSQLSCLTDDGMRSASSLMGFNEEEEKEEVQPLELEVSTAQEMLSASEGNLSLDLDEEDSIVPPLQSMSTYRNNPRNISPTSGQRMNTPPTTSNAGVAPNRLQHLPFSQRRFSGYNHSVARKPSLASVNEKCMDDSSYMSIPEFNRRGTSTFSTSTSSSSNASEAAKFSALRIARNMSLYMRAGALPVAATVVDSEDELESELREKLEMEIRQELEIEMEEFRRHLVLQMVGAAQPVTASVISVQRGPIMDSSSSSFLDVADNPELQKYAEVLDLTFDNDRANLRAAQAEREREDAAAIRSNTNRELGRLYLQMKSQRSFGLIQGLNRADDNVEDAFYDPELAKVVRHRARQDNAAPSWNVFWIALAATLIVGVLLGVGIVVGVYESS